MRSRTCTTAGWCWNRPGDAAAKPRITRGSRLSPHLFTAARPDSPCRRQGNLRHGPGARRDAHQGVPGGGASARWGAYPRDEALPRRGPAYQANPRRREEAQQAIGGPGRGADRGTLDRVGPRALRGLLARAPAARHREQAKAAHDRGAEAGERALARAGPEGLAAHARKCVRRPRRPGGARRRRPGEDEPLGARRARQDGGHLGTHEDVEEGTRRRAQGALNVTGE